MPGEPDPEVDRERTRCMGLVKALIDSIAEPTALSIVITSEKMFDGLASSPAARTEWRRCIDIMDLAAKRPPADRPACWAYDAIKSGLPAKEAAAKVFVTPTFTGTAKAAGALIRPKETAMAETTADPIKVDKPLTVDGVENGVVLDGIPEVNVELSREVAIETGIELINTAMGIDADPGKEQQP